MDGRKRKKTKLIPNTPSRSGDVQSVLEQLQGLLLQFRRITKVQTIKEKCTRKDKGKKGNIEHGININFMLQFAAQDYLKLSEIGEELRQFEDERKSLLAQRYVQPSSLLPLSLSLLVLISATRSLIGNYCFHIMWTSGSTFSLKKMCCHLPCAIHQCFLSYVQFYPLLFYFSVAFFSYSHLPTYPYS
jgi:hypothetical protein